MSLCQICQTGMMRIIQSHFPFFGDQHLYYGGHRQTVRKPVRSYYKNKILFLRNLLKAYDCLRGMNFKPGISREQLSMMSLDLFVAKDNAVHVIDMFVDQL